jgi:hypothetical protein
MSVSELCRQAWWDACTYNAVWRHAIPTNPRPLRGRRPHRRTPRDLTDEPPKRTLSLASR